MMNIAERDFVIKAFSSTFRRILHSSLGESAGEAILFFLRTELGRDPFEMLWEDPKSVYQAMDKVLGVGAKVLINILITRINQEYGLSMSPERFLGFMRDGDQGSIEKIRTFLRWIAEPHIERR